MKLRCSDCRESQSYVVGYPGSTGIAKLRFQFHPNLPQIFAASFVREALEQIESKSFQVSISGAYGKVMTTFAGACPSST